MSYAKTDIKAQIKRLENKHGKDVVLQALKSYIKEKENV